MLQPLLAAAPAGRFVYVADNRAGQPFFGAYGATKAAAEALVRSWAAETARIGPERPHSSTPTRCPPRSAPASTPARTAPPSPPAPPKPPASSPSSTH